MELMKKIRKYNKEFREYFNLEPQTSITIKQLKDLDILSHKNFEHDFHNNITSNYIKPHKLNLEIKGNTHSVLNFLETYENQELNNYLYDAYRSRNRGNSKKDMKKIRDYSKALLVDINKLINLESNQ